MCSQTCQFEVVLTYFGSADDIESACWILVGLSLNSYSRSDSFLISSIRTLMLIQGRPERPETNLKHFKWEVT